MVQDIARLPTPGPERSPTVKQALGDDELRARAEQSVRASERTIEEWRHFVEGLDMARRALRQSCPQGNPRDIRLLVHKPSKAS